jgi:hypothetical protein
VADSILNRHVFESELEKYRACDELDALAFSLQSIQLENFNDATIDALMIDMHAAILILKKWDPYINEGNAPKLLGD